MCAAFVANGMRVTLISPQVEDIEDSVSLSALYNVLPGINHIPLQLIPGILGISYLCKVVVRASKEKPDIVVTRMIQVALLLSLLGHKCIYEAHSPTRELGRSSFWSFVLCLYLKNYKRTVVISEKLKQIFLAEHPILADKDVLVLHDGADLVAAEAVQISERENSLTVGYVGSLGPGKGFDLACELATRLPGDRFIVAGDTSELDDEALAKVPPNMQMLGYCDQKQLESVFEIIDVALLPNRPGMITYGSAIDISGYNSPLKLFEYMAHGIPILLSDLPVLREVLGDEYAYFADASNIDEWVQGIMKLRNVSERASTSKALFDYSKKFSYDKRALALIDGVS